MNSAGNNPLCPGQDSSLLAVPGAQISYQAAPPAHGSNQQPKQQQDSSVHTMPLPQGWEMAYDPETGKPYFINHVTRETQWFDPRDVFTKPATFADCIGDELPVGWEQAHHFLLGPYFIDHKRRVNQLNDPRLEWLAVQADMVIGYLEEANNTNQSDGPETGVTNAQNQIYSNTTRQVVFVPGATVIPTPENGSKPQPENDYMNQKDIAAVFQVNQANNRTTSITSLENSSAKVALQFDDNSDYAVIDYPGGSGTSSMYEQIRSTTTTVSAMITTTPSVSTSSVSNLSNHSHGSHIGYHHQYQPNGPTTNELFSQAIPQPKARTSLQQQHQPAATTTSSCSSSPTGNNQSVGSGAAYHRNTFLLQQSLTEAKQRVAQLKRELGGGGCGSLSSPGSSSSNLNTAINQSQQQLLLHQHHHQNSSGSSNNDYNHNNHHHANNNSTNNNNVNTNVLNIIDKYYTKPAGPNKHRSDPIQV